MTRQRLMIFLGFPQTESMTIDSIALDAEQGRLRDQRKTERRIGRLLERNSRAAAFFDVTVTEIGTGKNKRLEICLHCFSTADVCIDRFYYDSDFVGLGDVRCLPDCGQNKS